MNWVATGLTNNIGRERSWDSGPEPSDPQRYVCFFQSTEMLIQNSLTHFDA